MFFDIDITTHNPRPELQRLKKLSLEEIQEESEHFQQIQVPNGAFYLGLDTNFQRIFVLFSNPFPLVYGEEVGKEVLDTTETNIINYTLVEPPQIPLDARHKEYEEWLLKNQQHCALPTSRCGIYHWGVWMAPGREDLGVVLTANQCDPSEHNQVYLSELLTSLNNVSHLKRLLLGAIDSTRRNLMKEAIVKLGSPLNQLWCHSNDECFSHRACLINLLSEPHINDGDLDWAMSTAMGVFEEGEFCIADIGRRFSYGRGSVSGIRGRQFIHFTRKWSGSRICLVSTMHRSVFQQAQNNKDSENTQPPLKRPRGKGKCPTDQPEVLPGPR